MAEERGFEPLHRVTGLLAFQASPFSHLGIPPYEAKKIALSFIDSFEMFFGFRIIVYYLRKRFFYLEIVLFGFLDSTVENQLLFGRFDFCLYRFNKQQRFVFVFHFITIKVYDDVFSLYSCNKRLLGLLKEYSVRSSAVSRLPSHKLHPSHRSK